MTTHVGSGRSHRPRVNRWLVAVVGLAAALVALGAWVLVDRTAGTEQPRGLASSSVATLLADRIATANRGARGAMSAFYTTNAVLEEHDIAPPVVTKGNQDIGGRIETMHSLGLSITPEGPVIQLGRYAAQAASLTSDPNTGWILVYELGKGNRIAHQWVLGGAVGRRSR